MQFLKWEYSPLRAVFIFQAIYWTFGQGDFNWRCEGVSYENTHRGRSIAMATYFYFLAKIIDMLDTFFFVLRKKQQHISFLHVYHHSIMVGVSFVAVSFLPGGHSSLLGILNSIVHVLMYFYYLLSAWNLVNIQTLGWWKKLLTQAQMVFFDIYVFLFIFYFFSPCRFNLSFLHCTLRKGCSGAPVIIRRRP